MSILFALAIYFLPTIIVLCNGHRNTAAIILLNTLLGWTGIVWLLTLVWSCVKPALPAPTPIIIYNNSGTGTQHTHEVRPWEPLQLPQGPTPIQQLAGRVHEAMIPPPIKQAKVLENGVNFETQEEWDRMSVDERTRWDNSFRKYYHYKNS
jgi:hypothetical protein